VTAGSDFVGYVFSVGGVTCAFLIVAIWTILAPASARPRRILIVTSLAFAVLSVYGVQVLVARMLIGSFKPFEASQVDAGRRTAIVVLGSGSVTAEDWDGRTRSFVDRAAAIRITEAARVFRLVDPALVISSGGDPHARRRGTPTGETMKDALLVAGVPPDRIVVETQSRTTRDEAVVVGPLLESRGVSQVILVTSGIHMTRALGTFRAARIHAIPAIAREFDPEPSLALVLLPSKEGLGLASENVHEVIGTSYYWLRGWWRR
jgi:uncharacterized SAM-binding protein YcdF (DUF218 family)